MTAHAVARHSRARQVDAAAVEELADEVKEGAQGLGRSPMLFGMAVNEALLLVRAQVEMNPRANLLETWEAAVSAMQVSEAAFAAAAVSEGSVERRVAGEMRSIPATGPQFYAHAGNWLTAFWLAITCRDQERMTHLCRVPIEVLRASGVEGDEYLYHWVDALQTYWLEEPGLVDKLTAAIETSHPDVATIAPRDLLQNVLYPPINLFYRFLRKEHGAFNAALAEALELHKRYWTTNEERSDDIEGCLALGPLAVACLAYDAGFPIEVESDYLPHHLLRRTWVGEFPV
ncbi:immunity 49 family protein [Streptomyces sp. FZ201]|uniref:immunity 49 family protein n=1 Tax=Streptomyces sp. FZ201 TaxID=3057122 RepID=UPI0021C18CD6|nr:immunity 49 family protein [Streptomyces sp. FZ201]